MATADLLSELNQNLLDYYAAVEAKGGTVPEEKNTNNLVTALESIPMSSVVVYTISALQEAINNGTAQEKYPAGTEIPDTWSGNDNPLIVAQYLDGTSSAYKNASGSNAEGVLLVRKYVEPLLKQWNSGGVVNYSDCTINYYLEDDYYANSSEELKQYISTVRIQFYTYNGMNVTLPKHWFLMSAYEVCNQGTNGAVGYEGIVWDYWRQQTGLSSPDRQLTSNDGRIMKDRSGTVQSVWLRSLYNASSVDYIGPSGEIEGISPTMNFGVLPACFIAKS